MSWETAVIYAQALASKATKPMRFKVERGVHAGWIFKVTDSPSRYRPTKA